MGRGSYTQKIQLCRICQPSFSQGETKTNRISLIQENTKYQANCINFNTLVLAIQPSNSRTSGSLLDLQLHCFQVLFPLAEKCVTDAFQSQKQSTA